MNQLVLKDRTHAFAVAVIKFAGQLPRNRVADVIARQLIRSGTSVGANYRAACRARSRAEFIAKMGIVEEEADETAYWLEILADTGIVTKQAISNLHNEASQIVAMVIKPPSRRPVTPTEKPDSPNSEFRTPHSTLPKLRN